MMNNLNTPLLTFPDEKRGDSHWTFRNAVEGVQIFGGIGGGKSSGPGRTLALRYLKAGFGGLVLTVKPDEKDEWKRYCEIAGRADDLVIIGPDHDEHFNFLDYEITAAGGGEAMTENLVQVLKTVIRASEAKDSGGSKDPFWETALDMLIFNVIDLCRAAYGTVSVKRMFEIVQSLPKKETKPSATAATKTAASSPFQEAYALAVENVKRRVSEWEKSLSVDEAKELNKIEDSGVKRKEYLKKASEALPEYRLFEQLQEFFNTNFKNLSEKTRSVIEFSFSGFLFRMLREPVYSLFCGNPSTVTPEDCLKGKIIVLDLPVKVYHKVGRDCQILFKYIWQRAMEKRKVEDGVLPVFLWADEAQNFLHEYDAEYQATARSSRIATVYISQNLPNYYASMSGAGSENRVKGFLGTLATKIFTANADIETNRYASDLIGDGYYLEKSRTMSMTGGYSASRTLSQRFDRIVRPEDFSFLRTGGEQNDLLVECYMHIQGNTLTGERSHIKLEFRQDFTP